MASLVLDPGLEEKLKRERALTGADRFDEVWDGVYVMSPLPNNEHQDLVYQLLAAIGHCVSVPDEAWVQPGCNVSDQATELPLP
jgi:hypothetical protein